MKKALSLFCVMTMLFTLAACSGQGSTASTPSSEASASQPAGTQAPDGSQLSPEDTAENTSSPEDGKVLVAYFSATGNTKGVAEQIAEYTGGDLYEIVPAEPYTAADLDYGNDQSRTSLEMNDPDARPEIGSEEISLGEYTTLYLGYPIWHGQAPRIMSTFVESYDFGGLTVIPFCASGGSGIGSSAQTLAEQAGGGNWLAGQRFSGGVSDADLQAWIEDLQQTA